MDHSHMLLCCLDMTKLTLACPWLGLLAAFVVQICTLKTRLKVFFALCNSQLTQPVLSDLLDACA